MNGVNGDMLYAAEGVWRSWHYHHELKRMAQIPRKKNDIRVICAIRLYS